MQEIYVLYLNLLEESPEKDPVVSLSNLENTKLRELVVDLVTEKYILHEWQKQNIEVNTEEDRIFRAVTDALYAFKARKINEILKETREQLKDLSGPDVDVVLIMKEIQRLDEVKRKLLEQQGITIF